MRTKKKNDILLVGSLLLLSLAGFLFWRFTDAPGKTIVVRQNGEIIDRISLAENGRYSFHEGGNVLVIRDGFAFMESADCPDRICVRQGRISRTGEVITCLPHRLTVTLEGEREDVDMLSGGGGG